MTITLTREQRRFIGDSMNSNCWATRLCSLLFDDRWQQPTDLQYQLANDTLEWVRDGAEVDRENGWAVLRPEVWAVPGIREVVTEILGSLE